MIRVTLSSVSVYLYEHMEPSQVPSFRWRMWDQSPVHFQLLPPYVLMFIHPWSVAFPEDELNTHRLRTRWPHLAAVLFVCTYVMLAAAQPADKKPQDELAEWIKANYTKF